MDRSAAAVEEEARARSSTWITCVGCQACAHGCKQWNSGGVAGPVSDETRRTRRIPSGACGSTAVHSYELEAQDRHGEAEAQPR
jgi:Fe-S-cluster-containing dehydrogenase component